MSATAKTTFRLTSGDRTALDAIAADMGVDRTTAVRKLIYDATEERGLMGHAAAAFIAGLIETYHANAAVVVATDGGDAKVTISGHEPTEARAVLVDNELQIEDPQGVAEIVLLRMVTWQPGELRWDGTLADLAAVAAERGA